MSNVENNYDWIIRWITFSKAKEMEAMAIKIIKIVIITLDISARNCLWKI